MQAGGLSQEAFVLLKTLFNIIDDACNIASNVSRQRRRFQDAKLQLEKSIDIVDKLIKLNDDASKTRGKCLRDGDVFADNLKKHLVATKDLCELLQSQQLQVEGRFQWPRLVLELVGRPKALDMELEEGIQQLRDSQNSLSLHMNAFQTSKVILLHQAVTEAKIRTCDLRNTTMERLDMVEYNLTSSKNALERIETPVNGIALDLNSDARRIAQDGLLNINRSEAPFFGVNWPKSEWFTGREQILNQIENALSPASSPERKHPSGVRVCSVYGLAGMGKTYLAIQYAHRCRTNFNCIFWVAADSAEKLEQGFVEMARNMGLASVTMESQIAHRAVKSWLSSPSAPTWLLILDNVDDFSLLNPWWPHLHGGSVLLTSKDRFSRLSEISSSSVSLQLSEFTLDEGTQMVKKRLQERIRDIDDEFAAHLASRFGLYPLYIDNIVALLCSNSSSMSELDEELESFTAEQELQDVSTSGSPYKLSLAETLKISMKRLDNESPQAHALLTTLAFFDPDDIPFKMIRCKEYPLSCIERTQALAELERRSYLNRHMERGVRMHRLVRDAALRSCNSCSSLQRAFDNAVCILRSSFPLHGLARDHMVEHWAECEKFQPHVLALYQRYIEPQHQGGLKATFEFIELIYSCGWYLCERGRFESASKLVSTARDTYKNLMATDPAFKNGTLFLADIYRCEMSYWNESENGSIPQESLAKDIYDMREAAVEDGNMEKDHPNRANGHMNYAFFIAYTDPWAAIEIHKKALEIREGSDRFKKDQLHGLALNYLNIGRCWWLAQRLPEAARCFNKVLGLMESRQSVLHCKFPLYVSKGVCSGVMADSSLHSTAWALLALGIVRADENKLLEAKRLMSESLELHIELMGETHTKTLMCYYRLGWLCFRLGELQEAEDRLSFALESYQNFSKEARKLPQAEVARTMHQLSKVRELMDPCATHWQCLRSDANRLLSEMLGLDHSAHDRVQEFSEADFDGQVTYWCR